MLKITLKKSFTVLSLLLLIGIAFALANPIIITKLYKSLYVKYVRITKGDFSSRFTEDELKAAIAHAAKQDWVQQQIAADLAPYKDGITHAQIDRWFQELQHDQNKLAKFRVSNFKVDAQVATDVANLRAYKTVYSVLALLASEGLIPDCEFIVAFNDYLAYVPEQRQQPAAILSFAKHSEIPVEKDTILIPDWMNVRYWDVLRGRITLANHLYPWQSKKSVIHWRGGCADSMQHRLQLVALKDQFKFLDVAMTEGTNPAKFVDPENSLQYKYQIALDGARCTWERMIWQMSSNTVLIKPNSPQVQWFHRGLAPYNNYVPLERVDQENVAAVYAWLSNNDAAARQISKNANEFAKQNFKTQDFFAYYAVLLREYAKLYKSDIPA